MRILSLICIFLCQIVAADTIKSYMNIANNIPQMEIKADPQAQAWARSARHVLAITSESIGETIIQANELAKQHGNPIFCLPQQTQLNSFKLNEIIQETYKELANQRSNIDSMTVSEIAWTGVVKNYPCHTKTLAQNTASNFGTALMPSP